MFQRKDQGKKASCLKTLALNLLGRLDSQLLHGLLGWVKEEDPNTMAPSME